MNTISLDLTKEQKVALKGEFEQLKTVGKKLIFWKDRLNHDYFLNSYCDQSEIQDFLIIPNTPKEIEELNRTCIETYYFTYNRIGGIQKLKTYSDLLEKFEKKIKNIKNKKAYVELELNDVLSKINKLKASKKIDDEFEYNQFLLNAFSRFYLNNERTDLSTRTYQLNQLVALANGEALAEYCLELIQQKEDTKETKRKETPHKMQMLILDYCGFFKDLTATEKGRLFEPIINRDSETTRQNLSSLYQYKSEKNLCFLLHYFTDLKLNAQIEEVKKDLAREKARRK